MLSRFSVKKPFYVFVAAIIVLVLGAVSLERSKTDLLPEMDIPYLAVITTDVGASPEQVENQVGSVLEGALSSVTGVESVQSMSAENYSMIFLGFADGTNMDSALVKVSAAVNEVSSQLPETAGNPTYMEISMDMMATMYLGVTDSNKTQAQLTEFVNNTIVPNLTRLDGVANVAVTGSVVDTINVELDQDKIDLVNKGILGNVNSQLSDARDQIDQGKAQISSGEAQLDKAEAKLDVAQKKLDEGQKALDAAKKQVSENLANIDSLNSMKAFYQAQVSMLEAQIQMATAMGDSATVATLTTQLQTAKAALEALEKQAGETGTSSGAVLSLVEQQRQLDNAQTQITNGKSQITANRQTLAQSKSQLASSESEYEKNVESARSSANIDKMLTLETLGQLISAQNLSMPAGYITDKSDEQWLIKAGEEYTNVKQLRSMVLTKIDGVGDVTLGDVANVTVTNNVGESYAKMNGENALVLSVTKTTTANTGEVSKAVAKQIARMESANEGLDIITVMDQGEYIDLYIWTILKSLLLGALLAIIVLALFLRDVKPTLIVGFSIPFSVLFAIVIMYFTNLSMNIMTLGAMTLAIGMLVDNSIVVMENIYRLRGRGVPAAAAAAQGARQVSGAVIASTITTICVFLPMVFTTGTVRQLMVPFALTIAYVLIASLIVALTAVPAIASKLFKSSRHNDSKTGGTIRETYGKALAWCLKHKAPVLLLAVALLGVSAVGVVNMGVVFIPEMTDDQVSITLNMPEDTDKETAYKVADQAIETISKTDGIADVGIVDSGFTASMVTSAAKGADTYTGSFIVYGMVDKEKIHTEGQMADLNNRLKEGLSGLDCEVVFPTSSTMMSSMSSSGATIEVTGTSVERVEELAEKVKETVFSIEGYTEPDDSASSSSMMSMSSSDEDTDKTLHLVFKKNKVARMGMTVAQIYQQLATDLSNSKTALTITDKNENNMDVVLDNEDYVGLTKENLMSWKFEDSNGDKHKLSSVAEVKVEESAKTIVRKNGTYYKTVTADVADGYNITLLSRQLQPALDKIDVPEGYSVHIAGTDEEISEMLKQMVELIALGFLLLYLVMVAQFQSLLSPFIIIFTVPLAFTGGLLALLITGEQLSAMSLLGFVILQGTVVNNGIVFVDYCNQLRLGGVAKHAALIATGKTRMRPILMTALTTILSMCALIFSQEIGAGMERGMALVVAGGLLYATVMTLFVVPVVYDIFSRKPMRPIDPDAAIDEEAGDAEVVIAEMGPDARETYEYESARDRRRRLRLEGGAHGKRALRKSRRQDEAAISEGSPAESADSSDNGSAGGDE